MASKKKYVEQSSLKASRYYDSIKDMEKEHKACVNCAWRDKNVKEKVYCTRLECVKKR